MRLRGEGARFGAAATFASRATFAVEASLAVALAYCLAALVWTFVDPSAALGGGTDWSPAASRAERPAATAYRPASGGFNIFRTSALGVANAEIETPVTTLNLTVVGARVSTAELEGSAIIRTPDNAQGVFRVGDEIVSGVELVSVEERRILLRRQGVIEALPFATGELEVLGAGGRNEGGPGGVTIAASTADGSPVVTIDALMSSVAPRPAPDGAGVAVHPLGDGAAFAAAGFEPGDVVRRINGQDVGDAERLRAALSALGAGSSVEASVIRGETAVDIEFVLE